MTHAGSDPRDLDRVAAHAVEMVHDGMVIGLGTGRAAAAFVRALGARVRRGLSVRAVATSERSEALARSVGVELASLDEVDRPLDLAFDGADEVAADLALTKGRGGALLRERVVAYEAARFVVLVTPEKLVERLGSRAPIPVEVVPFASAWALRHLQELGARPVIRARDDGAPFETEGRHWIADACFDPIDEPARLDAELRAIPGVVDTGLFLEMADLVLVGGPHGVRELRR